MARVATAPPSAVSSFVQAPISEGAPITVIVVQAILVCGGKCVDEDSRRVIKPQPPPFRGRTLTTAAILHALSVTSKNRIPGLEGKMPSHEATLGSHPYPYLLYGYFAHALLQSG
jgi:hypothetical protein